MQIGEIHKNRSWVVVMDGALHLWTLIASVLKGVDYTGILDIIHAVEYLWDVANALNKNKKKKWTDTSGFILDCSLS